MTEQPKRSGTGRWYIMFLICLMYLITYLDRVNISTVGPVISKEFGLLVIGVAVWAFWLDPEKSVLDKADAAAGARTVAAE